MHWSHMSFWTNVIFVHKAIGHIKHISTGLYHPLDGVINFKYKLLYFLTTNKNFFEEKGTSF
jgi:hypothetical protein